MKLKLESWKFEPMSLISAMTTPPKPTELPSNIAASVLSLYIGACKGIHAQALSDHVWEGELWAFFGSLYRCLARGARAVFQVYPENIAQLHWSKTKGSILIFTLHVKPSYRKTIHHFVC